MVGFGSASLFLTRKREEVTQGGTRGIDHPTWRRTQRAVIVKGWEDKRDLARTPDTFTNNKNNTIVFPLTLQQLNPDSPNPIYTGM